MLLASEKQVLLVNHGKMNWDWGNDAPCLKIRMSFVIFFLRSMLLMSLLPFLLFMMASHNRKMLRIQF